MRHYVTDAGELLNECKACTGPGLGILCKQELDET
jgi:hypothetical protein